MNNALLATLLKHDSSGNSTTYSISKESPSGAVAEYHLTKTVNGVTQNVGDTINIPLDMVVQSGSVKTCTTADAPVPGYKVGDKYIDLLIANSNDQHIYVLVNDLVDNNASGIKYDNTTSGLTATNAQAAIDELDNSKSDTIHTHNYAASDTAGGAANLAKKLTNTTAIGSVTQPVYFNASGVPVPTSYTVEKSVPSNAVFTDTTYNLATTSANGLMSSTDKVQVDATKIMPQSKSITTVIDTHTYQDFVIPLIAITNGNTNTYFYGQILLKRTNAAGGQIALLNAVCCKSYNEEKAIYYIDKSDMWTAIRPCSFTYNSKKYFGIHVKIIASDYDIIRIDAKTTTNFDIITPIYIYNTNTSTAINQEVYDSLNFNPGESKKPNFYAVPTVINADGTTTKILTFSTVPASATATGIKGDIAYDANYMYVCTDANVWKRTELSTW